MADGRLACLLLLGACVGAPPASQAPGRQRTDRWEREPDPLEVDASADSARSRVGQSIVVGGELVDVGTRVVLFSEPDGFDARRTSVHFEAVDRSQSPDAPRAGELRYQPGRVTRSGDVLVPAGSHDRELLQATVDQFVLHYDVCGTSARCFRVLHDLRGLSVHFLLDVDGTLYQTLDLADQAWHASDANPRSIGIEIANMGARAPGDTAELDAWSIRDRDGLRLVVPSPWRERVRTPGFVARPARSELVRGSIHGQELVMLDFTPEQYDALVALTAALCRTFPRIVPDAPRDAAGRVRTDALSASELERFRGIVGHHHLTRRKIDPGPAFRWEAFLGRVRAQLAPAREAAP